MTVKELIEWLQRIDDQSKEVYFEDESWGAVRVNEVVIDERYHKEHVLLKN
ncbi:hypothetical protein [Bacillus benzoevorans]|uniref:Uncharacterized protein n=1 Tax=Bacillus benzoevorans TaxID=1456 RepID=A0A7X0HTI2_9BACI|nr:hypothetical protein [Bacillus benzoevorans]MBB6446506.1 hypothetical protein [Bacillus benzoevorans]